MKPPFDQPADLSYLVDEVTDVYAAELTLSARVLRVVGRTIRVVQSGVPDVDGTLVEVGRDYLRVADNSGFWLLASNWIDGISEASRIPPIAAQPRASEISTCGLASALRQVKRSGRSVSLLIGERWIAGSPSLVGKDFLDVGGTIVPLARMRACRVWY